MKIIKYSFYDEQGNFIGIIKEAFKNCNINLLYIKNISELKKYDKVCFNEDYESLPYFNIIL